MNKKLLIALAATSGLFLFYYRQPIMNKATSLVNIENRLKFQPFFRQAENANGLPKGILESIAEQESNFSSDIISGKIKSSAGAVGLMQIIPKWHPNVNALDPVASINYAGSFLKSLYKSTGSWEKALASYNWGLDNVQKKGLANMPQETKNYVSNILSRIS